jgi:hypothetical protein
MSRISDALIERVHLGEATEEQRARVLADPDARARLEALPALDRAFLEAHPADVMVARIHDRARIAAAREEQRGRRVSWTGGFALLAPVLAVLLAVFLVVGPPDEAPDTWVEPTTTKGLDPSLRLFRQGTDGAVPLTEDQVARPGDVVQVGYVAGDALHGVIVSIDGRGAVTLHFPADAAGSTALTPGAHNVPEGFRLDDAPSFERFFLVTSDAPIDVNTVVAAAEALALRGGSTGSLALPAGLAQTSSIVRKETP